MPDLTNPDVEEECHDAIPFIELKNITRVYKEGGHEQYVLKNVSLKIQKGETIALLGRSGSGKSTLLNIISGIDVPSSGSVLVDGKDLTSLSEDERTLFRREHIGFIYQFFNLVPSLTAQENIEFILDLNNFSVTETRNRALEIMQRLDIENKSTLFPAQLSGGEQQRVAVARALVHCPGLVLADEPTGNLDAKTGKSMLKVLNAILEKNNSALLLVTHSLEVAKTADRIVTLEDGVLVARDGHFAW